MPKPVKSPLADNDEMNDTDIEKYQRYDDSSDPDTRTYELQLWPPPRLQAYCLDHFLMECEIYHEQENDRYNKLVAHSRRTFLGTQNKTNKKSQLTSAPTRLQPSRRAKEKHTALGTTPPTTPDATTPQGPPKPKRPSNFPFKPAKLEKAFKESQQGAIFRILAEFHKKLELQKSWEDYRLPLEDKIKETAKRLLAAIEKGRNTDTNCVFRGPLGIGCRYCGFVDTVQDDETTTPRKLAPPAAMHDIKPPSIGSDTKESELMFRGTNFTVDACGEKTMIVLVSFKGLLDLCAELFQEEVVMPDSPTSLFARLSSIKIKPRGISAAGTKRQLDELRSDGGRKRRKYGTESVQGESSLPSVNERISTS